MGRSSLVVVALMALVLLAGACGGGAEQAADTETEASSTPAGSEEPEEPSSEAAATDLDLGVDTIRIGFMAPFSGPVGYFGEIFANSLQVEIDKINEAGGLGGAQLELVTRDTELNPQLAVQGAQEFTGDESVQLIVGPLFTGFFNAVKTQYEQTQTINCQPGVNAPQLMDGLQYSFRVQEGQDMTLPRLLDYFEEEGVESVGLVYENDDAGKAYDALLTEQLAERGMEYAGFQAVRPDDQTHRPQVEALAGTDAIIMSNNSTSAGKTGAAAGEVGYEGILTGFSGLFGFTYIEGAGDAADGTIMSAWYPGAYTRTPPEEMPTAYGEHVAAILDEYGTLSGPQSGIETYNGAVVAGNCIELYRRAVEAAGSLEPDAVAEAWENLSVPAEEMPSAVNAEFGPDDHEAYSAEEIWLSRWVKDDEGWHVEIISEP